MQRRTLIRFCYFCGRPFPALSKRRKFCDPRHQREYAMWSWLKRAMLTGRLAEGDWRVDLCKRLERMMFNARAETARELGYSLEELTRLIETQDEDQDAERKGGEAR